ncbi:MAG TPA: F0F1 ATP synthase subunit epsilon [Deltaproteobacteria bacterium]|nr:F0F1 ATP synthase subunit epsilon [Deltaproteobacteria bacterium]
MNCKILLPSEVFLDKEVAKVVAEAGNGRFCLLPQHIDFVAALVPGMLDIVAPDGTEEFYAVDEGILIKRGADVMVSTRNALKVPDLGQLRLVVEEQFKTLDEKEKAARTAAARLEADLVRRFMELRKNG